MDNADFNDSAGRQIEFPAAQAILRC